MSKILFVSISVVAALTVTGSVSAKLCGDDVNGVDVPCACGDTVVSTVVLGNDPVTAAPCSADGLLVRVSEGSAGITIDLQGKSLRGDGAGSGIRVSDGGSGGARLVSSGAKAHIIGFQEGVIGHGENTIALVEDLVVQDSRRDGIRITSPSFVVRRTAVSGSGRDGYSLDGNGYTVLDTVSSGNGRFGYFLKGKDGVIGRSDAPNVAEKNGDAGFNLLGGGINLVNCAARGNGKDGIKARGESLGFEACRSEANVGDGFTGTGGGWYLASNDAVNNQGNGILVRGNDLVDGGKNRGSGNLGGSETRSAVQCEISGEACK